jgi:hypothetical protein
MASVTKTFRLGSTPAVKVYLPFYHRLFGIEELMMEALHLTPKKKKKEEKNARVRLVYEITHSRLSCINVQWGKFEDGWMDSIVLAGPHILSGPALVLHLHKASGLYPTNASMLLSIPLHLPGPIKTSFVAFIKDTHYIHRRKKKETPIVRPRQLYLSLFATATKSLR